MPIYVYQCTQCKTKFEIRASFHEKELGLKPICPNCQANETHQVFTAGMFMHAGGSSSDMSPGCCSPNANESCCR